MDGSSGISSQFSYSGGGPDAANTVGGTNTYQNADLQYEINLSLQK